MPLDFPWPWDDQSKKVLAQLRWKLSNRFVQTGVGLFSKLVGGYMSRVTIHNKQRLIDFVENRPAGRSLVTVSNHYSCLDDPLVWGAVFSFNTLVNKNHLIRWIPTAHDICFTKRLHVWFFARGRCVPCVRGDGVYQKGVDFCIERLNMGDWVHVFPEGGVNMTKELMRLKWGVGRLISDAKQVPIVLPFFHLGYDDILPNEKPYIPRPRQKATVFIGEPMDFTDQLNELRAARKSDMEIRKSITDTIQEELARLKVVTEKLHFGSSSSNSSTNNDSETNR